MERARERSLPLLPHINLSDPHCPSRRALDLLAERWVPAVVYVLAGGTKRYSTLRREVAGVSHKMLTQTLRTLEHEGLVQRTVYAVVPPQVEYALTPLGETLVEPLAVFLRWANEQYQPEDLPVR